MLEFLFSQKVLLWIYLNIPFQHKLEYTFAIVVVVDVVVAGFVVIACNVVVTDASVIDNVVAKDNFYYIFFEI